MRQVGVALLALTCGLASPAWAGVKTVVRSDSYKVSGDTGAALMRSMNRKGPKHGFLARAMAQTSYTIEWKMQWARQNGGCKLSRADAVLFIKYRYPEVAHKVDPRLKARWNRFMSGVRKHEEMHGKIARDMVTAAQRSVSGLSTARDPNCIRTQRAAGAKVSSVYAVYVAKQNAFDDNEHRSGGNVDHLITGLVY